MVFDEGIKLVFSALKKRLNATIASKNANAAFR
jgi:hypothetical protein